MPSSPETAAAPDSSQGTAIRLLIADDHAVVRHGLKHVFALTGRIQVAGEAENGMQALELLLAEPFDAALLDMSMPGINGLDLIMRIRSHKMELPLIAFSMTGDPHVARLAQQAGATCYLTKDSSPETLITAIEKAVMEQRCSGGVPKPGGATTLARPARNDVQQSLSKRELQIFRMLVSGKRVNDIAEELAISNKAVSTYKTRLMQKMNFANNAELVCYGLARGLRE